ncbi:MAG: serine--tRNA ligase [Micavibrio aeruginosavorus]|uniref:Serine--tRNA ligase n=1 Tax=Micavibrio aeruginosavorus TaxID=349221 RepID=A0A2W5N3A3_9BACT|nr:MAG: serine--tRNA ligase [Micavibrio aeruginosavorus]
MLDIKFIRENADLVKQNCANRNVSLDIDHLLEVDAKRRKLEQDLQHVRSESNKISSQRDMDPAARAEAGKKLRAEGEALEAELRVVKAQADDVLKMVPNLTHPQTPIGAEESDSVTIKTGKFPVPSFSFKPKDHLDLGRDLKIIDMEAGSKVAGSGFYFLKGKGALLEIALQHHVIKKLIARGYQFQITPDIANNDTLLGTGYVPRGNETNTYCIEDTNLSLIATAEITLCGQFRDEVLAESQLPVKLVGLSHCFRTERAGGKATRGIYRVHQFTKVEMVVLCLPEDSEKIHQELLEIEMEVFDDLGLSYRVLDIASGDLGASAYRKFDIEAWMPGRGEAGEYGEVTSTSNCTEYQSRRLNIKYKPKNEKAAFVHTLNGTGVAISRAIVGLLENYQTKDGDIKFPPAVAQILGFSEILKSESV